MPAGATLVLDKTGNMPAAVVGTRCGEETAWPQVNGRAVDDTAKGESVQPE
jgi:hypothetical protein